MRNFRSRTITEYLQIIRYRKMLIFFVTLTMLISTFFVISSISDIYESRATVVVASNQYDRQTASARVAAATEQLKSRSFLEPIIHRYKLYPGSIESGAIDSAVGRMNKDITLETKYRANLPEKIFIAYKHTDPHIAKSVATDLVALFDSVNVAIEKQVADEINALESEIAEVENELNLSSQQRAAAAARGSAALRSQSRINAVRMQRNAASSSVEALSDKQLALERQIAEQKRQISEQQNYLKNAPPTTTGRGSSSHGILLVRKAEIEAQIKDFASQYTDQNPKLIQAKTQLAEIDRQIAQLETTGTKNDALASPAETRELRALQRELVRMETELEITKREIERKKQNLVGVPSIATASAAGLSPASIVSATNPSDIENGKLRNLYKVFLDKKTQLQQASLQKNAAEAAGLNAGFFQIIDLPTEPNAPAGPNRGKLRFYAILFSLFIGLAVAAVVEVPRFFSIRNHNDVEYYLGAPVIALIPESLTPPERSRRRMMALARSFAIFLLAGMMVPILIILFNYLQVFQILANR